MIDVKKIKAIGFDVDGTLYKSTDELQNLVGKQILSEAAKRLGQDPDELAEEYLRRRDEYRSNTMTLNSFGLPGEEIFQAVWEQFEIADYIKKDDKLSRMIMRLKEKYHLFLISNGKGYQVELKLKYLGLNYKDFNPRIYCYDQGWVKPDPAPFLAAMESLQYEPKEIVYIGDREDVDVIAAQAVGMRGVLVGAESKVADASCPTIYDVQKLFE